MTLGHGAGELLLAVADGMDHPLLAARAPFDLLIANILAGPLIDARPARRSPAQGAAACRGRRRDRSLRRACSNHRRPNRASDVRGLIEAARRVAVCDDGTLVAVAIALVGQPVRRLAR